MCYFLYGGINKEVNPKELEKVKNNSDLHFAVITNNQHKSGNFPTLTNIMCDCGTPIGTRDKNLLTKQDEKELRDISEYITNLRSLKNIKNIWIQKLWSDDDSKCEITVHIDEINLTPYLTNLEDGYVYKIGLY